MSVRPLCTILGIAAILALTLPALSQVTYSASEGRLPLSVGGGFSGSDPDVAQTSGPRYALYPGYGQGDLWGATAWADAGIHFGPRWLHALSIEAQYRNLFTGGSTSQQNIKESTAGGGVLYTFSRWRSFHPYGKYICSLGKAAFTPIPQPDGRPAWSHDSRAVNAFGGGLEVRITRHIWARGDYEFQAWGPFLGSPNLEPQAVTAGAMYTFARSR